MGIKLYGIDVSGIVKSEIGDKMLTSSSHAVTLTKVTIGTRTVGEPTSGTNPTTAAYTGKGFVDAQAKTWLGKSLVDDGSKIVVLIGDSFTVAPALGDKVTIESATYRIEEMDRDPAAATYTCKVRLA